MNSTFYNTLALKKFTRSISMAFAGIYKVLVTEFTNRAKASVMLHNWGRYSGSNS